MKDIYSATTAADLTGGLDTAPLVGNPRRIRDLAVSMLERPAPVSTMVGNPRRLRRLEATAFAA